MAEDIHLAFKINSKRWYCVFHQKTNFMVLFSLTLFILALPALCQAKTVIVPIQFRTASEVLPVVENLLSKDGKATIDFRTNSIVITDDDETISEIREFLESYDKRVQQARIRVRFQEVLSSQDRSISAEGTVSGKNWEITTNGRKRDGVSVYLNDGNRYKGRRSEYWVNVMSGSPAYIVAGKDIPYRERWIDLCRRYARYVDTVHFQRIETGMEVTPVILGDHANIEITPRISHEASEGGRRVVQFTSALTRLSVPLGQWMNIGGTDETSNEVIRAILESGSGKKDSCLSISLMVEAYQ